MERRHDKEIMDDMSITDSRIDRALDELRIINMLLGGRSVSKDGILHITEGKHRPLTILDVGSGASDTLANLPNAKETTVISMDLNTGVCRYVRERNADAPIVCADAFRLPVRDNSVDIVHLSLFLHHFTEHDMVRLLSSFLAAARLGVVINDLRRSAIAHAAIWMLTRLLPASPMVRHDGPLSVQRAFSRRDLESVIARLRVAHVTIRRRWAFRWLVVLRK
ncbi:MAG: methyltransferase domain-containing protein [Acidobacteriota bacterium]